jgi:TonB-dependent SusC/RagA subfamily outer membrane receptor
VKIKGSTTGVSADQNGNFKIDVKQGDVLVVSAASFEGAEVKVGSGSTVNVALKSTTLLNEVVVTALGIRRAKNTLPYAAQQISGDDVNKVRPSNLATALSGKISGLQIQQGNGVGTSTNVVIRGAKSLTNTNQALFVVDGVPVDNSINNATGGRTGKGGTDQTTGRGGYDYGNAAADINPDDIESVNVLKGAAASALYGSRAANGVIMITTKKANKGLGITINSAVTVGNIDKSTFAKYQNEYGAGYSSTYQKDGFFYFDANGDGVKDYVTPTSEDASYGVKFDPNLMVLPVGCFRSGWTKLQKSYTLGGSCSYSCRFL